jgi:hypothetical protein
MNPAGENIHVFAGLLRSGCLKMEHGRVDLSPGQVEISTPKDLELIRADNAINRVIDSENLNLIDLAELQAIFDFRESNLGR